MREKGFVEFRGRSPKKARFLLTFLAVGRPFPIRLLCNSLLLMALVLPAHPRALASGPGSSASAPAGSVVRILAEVVSIEPAKKHFSVKESPEVREAREAMIHWDDATRFTLGNTSADANYLAAGDAVKVTYQTVGGRNLALTVSIIKGRSD